MHFLLNIGIFQPATLVLPEGIHILISNGKTSQLQYSFIAKKGEDCHLGNDLLPTTY